MAALPNVVAKLSGVATEADHAGWRPGDLQPAMTHALECFGPARLMFGSDWPVSERAIAYPDWVALVDETLAGCSEDERRAVYRDTAARVYRLTPR